MPSCGSVFLYVLVGSPTKTTNTRVVSAQAVLYSQHQLTPISALGVPHVSAPVYQEDGWSRVGAQGKHRHVPASSPPNNCQVNLLALPAIALASIFHYLDSVDGFNFAQTCHACAAEFAHHKAQKIWEELALTVTRAPPTRDFPYYGTYSDPVSLCVKWEKNSGSALRCFYATSQQPDCVEFVNELWRQAWPKTLWADVLRDGLSWAWPFVHPDADSEDGHSVSWWDICINVHFQLSSDEPMQLPWDWLAKTLLYAIAAGSRHHLNANAPQQVQEDLHKLYELSNDSERPARTCIQVSLHMPAQADDTQLVMMQDMFCYPERDVHYEGTHDGWHHDEDIPYVTLIWHVASISDFWYIKPSNEQKVSITGSWCQALPDASVALMNVRFILTDRPGSPGLHMTLGDDIMVNLKRAGKQLEDLRWAQWAS